MSARGRFTQSGPFRATLREYVIETDEDDGQVYLIHNECADVLVVTDKDMAEVIDAILDHDCTDATDATEDDHGVIEP